MNLGLLVSLGSTPLSWALVGLIVGGISNSGRLGFGAYQPWVASRWGWIWTLALGVSAALLGGAIGRWLFGPFSALATALWVSILITASTPWMLSRSRGGARRQEAATTQANADPIWQTHGVNQPQETTSDS